MKPLLFIAAEPRECLPFLVHWESSKPAALPVHWAREGRWKGREALIVANGAGAERARAAVLAAPPPSAVCNIGFCGALVETLAPGDIFVATQVRSGDARNAERAWTTQPIHTPVAASGILLSIGRIAQTAREKRELARTGASVVEMEAAGAARASEDLQVPFCCIRAVSDLSGEDFANDFNRCLMPDGRFNVPRLVRGALSSPVRRFGELIRLSERTSLASKNLGDFLGNCDF
jgi:adenosylhomocysteine nucleosidase